MIRLENVSIQTRVPILSNASYTFEPGQIYGIVAINGAGKTTIFRSIMQLIPIASGNIYVDNECASKKMDSMFYYESVEWFDGNLSGIDYVKFVSKVWKSEVDVQKEILKWKVQDYIKLPIKKYSLGMKQRLLIMLYIVSDAKYLIMDEITNALDEENRTTFFNTIQSLAASGKMVILSSHYEEDLLNRCDVVLEIRNKKLMERANDVL